MLNPIFWKKVQGQKHPGSWEIAERKVPSVKMLFKTNTNGHKHPIISLIIIEQDTIGETIEITTSSIKKKQSKRLMGCSFTNTEWHSLCMYMCIL